MKKPKYDSLRVGIVCSRFNEFVVNALLDGAKRGLKARGVREKNIETHWVPGAFEIPVMARLMAVSQKFDALVALGAVIRGETAHFEYVAGPCAEGIMQVQLETLIPIGFGVLTVENVEQAAARSRPDDTNKGFEAAQVALD
ncbi:MAG: 6,7-dimethyl-8-ribityllumazine synthase, partial [Actinobacteria bacterium]|nr:6,7-dimethyl-8-ribityllumazine synthase [Actinomycetota bacterium]NDH92938.1 6,7-dimethyl-8-ribityllumazine synthase [Actinomycetota bacterium]